MKLSQACAMALCAHLRRLKLHELLTPHLTDSQTHQGGRLPSFSPASATVLMTTARS